MLHKERDGVKVWRNLKPQAIRRQTEASYALFSVWDYKTNSYKSLAKDLDGFLSTKTSDYGISSGGGKADLTAFRIVAASGAEVGTTYLADLKFDTATNLPKETEMRNPNRPDC